jgi:YHS domain-containing protein
MLMNARKLASWTVVALFVSAAAVGCKKKDETAGGSADAAAAQTSATVQAGDANAWYRCPMEECHYAQKGPGKCPTCGMDLVKAPEGWAPSDVGDATSCTGSSCGCPMAAGMQGAPGTGVPTPTAVKTAKELAPEKIGQSATCPVTGETFQVTESTPAVNWEGKVYLFCCPGCVPRFLADPAKYAAAAAQPPTDPGQTPPAAALEIKTAGELAPERIGQTETCSIGGDTFTIAADTPAVAYEGKVHLFGCMGCANAFVANPANPTPSSCPHHGAQ